MMSVESNTQFSLVILQKWIHKSRSRQDLFMLLGGLLP